MPRRALSFFFQAEDGIRGWSVTGVQTCALPISRCGLGRVRRPGRTPHTGLLTDERQLFVVRRSEERRVGKECRSRGRRYHQKKKEYEGRRGRERSSGRKRRRRVVVREESARGGK